MQRKRKNDDLIKTLESLLERVKTDTVLDFGILGRGRIHEIASPDETEEPVKVKASRVTIMIDFEEDEG